MQYPFGQPLCPQSTKLRHGALLGLILLLIGLLPSLALAQGMPGGGGPPLGGGGGGGGPAPSAPTTVTVDVAPSSTSSPGEPFTPPVTTLSPEAAALKKEADALKKMEDILPDSLKSKAPELLEKIRTGKTKIETIEAAVHLYALMLRNDLNKPEKIRLYLM